MIRTTRSRRFLEQGHGGGMRQWRSAEGVEELGVHLVRRCLLSAAVDGLWLLLLSSVPVSAAAKLTANLRGSGVIGKITAGLQTSTGPCTTIGFVEQLKTVPDVSLAFWTTGFKAFA